VQLTQAVPVFAQTDDLAAVAGLHGRLIAPLGGGGKATVAPDLYELHVEVTNDDAIIQPK
jgi:hypothetical protein